MRNFEESEFECRCGCAINRMDERHLFKLDYARDLARTSFIINSGCRCEAHNKAEGGSNNSSHLTTEARRCTATDIKAETSMKRFRILNGLIEAGFNRIGIAKTFIHVDSDQAKTQNVIWVY